MSAVCGMARRRAQHTCTSKRWRRLVGGPIYTLTPSRWSLRGATSGGGASRRAAPNYVRRHLTITVRFHSLQEHGLDGEMSGRRRRRSPSARHPTYFPERRRVPLRFSRSVPDSTADLTFDPVSWSSSTGTQPRSVTLQNQNNKARRRGNESRQPVYEAQNHTPA